jgi:hypothetical protein
VSCDSLFLSVDYVYKRLLCSETEVRIEEKTIMLNTIDKYVIYFILTIGFYIFDFLSWGYVSPVIQICLLSVTFPGIQELLLTTHESQSFINSVKDKQIQIGRLSLCYTLSRIINSLAKNNLDAEPKVTYQELMK